MDSQALLQKIDRYAAFIREYRPLSDAEVSKLERKEKALER